MRVGIVGANWGLVGHLPVWRAIEDVEVVAICTAHEASARKAAADHDIPLAFWDHRQMLADADIDIADIGTMPASRQEMVLDALAAGKHVISYNPFAVDTSAARAQYNAQAGQVVGAVEAQMQWLPQFRYMRELIQDGFIGHLAGVTLRCHFGLKTIGDATFPALTRPTGYPTATGYNWLGQRASGASVVRNIGGQCFHGLVALFGEVAEVTASVSTELAEWQFADGGTYRPDTCDTAFAILRFCNGGTAQISLGWAVPSGRAFELEAWGSEGKVRATAAGGFPDTPTLLLYGARMDRSGASEPLRPLWQDREEPLTVPDRLMHPPGSERATADGGRYRLAMFGLFSAMVDAVRGEGEARPDFRQALHVHEICEAIERSGRTRRWEAVPAIN